MAEINKKEQTPFEKEKLETEKLIANYKIPVEANVVSILYKNPERLYDVTLSADDITNNIWKVYYQIIYDIVIEEHKSKVDEVVVGVYLDKHSRLKAKYDEYGGYQTIINSSMYVHEENFDAYLEELKKWNCVMKLCHQGFPVKDNLSKYADMSTEEIYNSVELNVNDLFSKAISNVKSYDMCDDIYKLIDDLDKGSAIGLPYHNMPNLTKETGGQYLGSITLLGGVSNAGKSTVARSLTIPSILQTKERVVIIINEDSVQKWQREMLVWVCNNIFKYNIQKHIVRNGHYSDEVKQMLIQSAKWLEEHTQNHLITIIPFLQYQTAKAIKVIKKYASMNVKYFILDTFKMDAGQRAEATWLAMQQSMVDIKDVIKSEALNVHILITFQLEKTSAVTRYYTQNNIGMAKNIVDVASTCIMIRDVFTDEYPNEKNAISVYDIQGGNKVEQKLNPDKNYQIFFIVKNQEGSSNRFQIVAEHDKSRNIIHEIGTTYLKPSW